MKKIGKNSGNYILGLDVSTKTIGIALFEDAGDKGNIQILTHVTPNIKPKPAEKLEELFQKAEVFEDFIKKYATIGIKKVVIEEPLLSSNNVNTVGVLKMYNGIISRIVYKVLGVVPEFISSYDSRKYAFPELMEVRQYDKKGNKYPDKKIETAKPVLFGGFPWDVDKKVVIWEKIADMEPQITWLYNRNKVLSKENYDMTDAYCVVLAKMKRDGIWK